MGRGARGHGPTDKQRDAYDYFMKNPGTSLCQMAKELSMRNGSANYSVDELERRGLLRRERDGRITRFYTCEDTNGMLNYEGHRRHRIVSTPTEPSSES